MAEAKKLVSASVEDAVATVVLDREHRLNALVPEMHEELQRTLDRLEADTSVRAIVLTGAGRAFCAGGDIRAMIERPFRGKMSGRQRARARAEERRRLDLVHDTVRRMVSLTTPIVAAINGPAAGAGLAIALATDFRVAAESAVLSVAYPQMGLTGDSGISVLLAMAIGESRARAALLRGDRWQAGSAADLGLVDEVVPDDAVLERARAAALLFCSGSPVAVGLIRSRVLAPHDFEEALAREADAMLDAQESLDHLEAITAFIERRTPRFRGE
jgi:enoyl-CoA hydratase/carnithine racemase